jgi:hypothetical protein
MGTRPAVAAASDDGGVDYTAYTDLELQEALAGIRADRYPQNHARLAAEVGRRPAIAPEADETRDAEPAPVEPTGPYVPNVVSLEDRLRKTGLALAMLAYAAYGAWSNDLYVPSKHGRGIHLHGDGTRLAFVAACFAAIAMGTQILDHYDRRDNERTYRRIADVAGWIGVMVFIAAVLVDVRTH